MDFVEGLPLSDGHDTILVVVCHLTKMALFIPTFCDIDAQDLAHIFLSHCQERIFRRIAECNKMRIKGEMPFRATKKDRLSRGCCERERARKSVSKQVRDNTK